MTSSDDLSGRGGPARTGRWRGAGLRTRVLALVVLTLAPAAALLAVSAFEQHTQAREALERRALEVARSVADAERRALTETGEILRLVGLAAQDHFDTPEACADLMRRVMRAYPRYHNMASVTPEGAYECGALTPDAPLSVADRAYFRRAVATGALAIGDPQIGRLTGSPSINVALPVFDEAGVTLERVLFAAIDLTWLASWLDVGDLPEGTILTLLDASGRVIIRYPDEDLWFGRSLAGLAWVDVVLSQRMGIVTGFGPAGEERLFAFTTINEPSPEPGDVHVVVGIPMLALERGVETHAGRNLLLLALVGLVTALLAWYGADLFVVRRTRALVQTAEALARGDLAARSGLAHEPDELGQLARAFDDMAASVQTAQDARERLITEAREAVRAREEFLSVASHELKTPLTGLSLAVQATRRMAGRHLAGGGPTWLEENLDAMATQIERLNQMIANLLDLKQAQSGDLVILPTDEDWAAVAREAVRRLRLAAEQAGSTLTFEGPEALPGRFDRLRLEQLLFNLVGNAVKYGEGQPIEVRLTQAAGAGGGLDRVSIEVEDHGIGISPDRLHTVFDRFTRAVTPGAYAGLGIGLWVVRRIVEGMQGEVEVTSQPGQGTKFQVTLPRSVRGSGEAALEAEADRNSRPG